MTNKENAWFNLSHSDSAVALVLSRIGDVGIDIERSTYEKNYLNIAKRFFHDEEKEALDQLDPHTAQRQSHMLWCLKEAYIKAIGKGLTQPLNSFKFELKHHHIHLYEPEEPNISERWTCHYHELEKNYGLSVCIPYDTPVEYFCLNSNKKIQPGAI
ncbi:TPA: 4'-phosphopantetheinyl transferase family protein [Aeromonas hydrophila]